MLFLKPFCLVLSMSLFVNSALALTPEQQASARESLVANKANKITTLANLKDFNRLLLTLEVDLQRPIYQNIQLAQKVTALLSSAAVSFWVIRGLQFEKSTNIFFTVTTILNGLTQAAGIGFGLDARKLAGDLKLVSGLLEKANDLEESDRTKYSAELSALAERMKTAKGSELGTLVMKSGATLTMIVSIFNILALRAGNSTNFGEKLFGSFLSTGTGILSTIFSTASILSEPDRLAYAEQIRELSKNLQNAIHQLEKSI